MKRRKTKQRRSTVKAYERKYAAYRLGSLGSRPPDPPSTWSGTTGAKVRRRVVRRLIEKGAL